MSSSQSAPMEDNDELEANTAGSYVRGLAKKRRFTALNLGFFSIFFSVVAMVAALVFRDVFFTSGLCLLSIFLGYRLNQQSRLVYNARRGAKAEEVVSAHIKELLRDREGWHLFNNILLKDIGDVDHLLVGPKGIVIVETKSQQGTMMVSQGRIGFRQPMGMVWPKKDFVAQTRTLADALRALDLTVHPVLCFTRTEVKPMKLRGVYITDIAHLVNELDRHEGSLDEAQVHEIIQKIRAIAQPHKAPSSSDSR